MIGPMTDDALITLAEHRFALAERDGATRDDCRQLRDIFPAVLQRLREKVELTRDLVAPERLATDAPKSWEKQAAGAGSEGNDDQMQLSLLHL
ncbi:hypothetical protein LH128_17382 [Sphingomonas sp. LH128]|nr:hypothetical protein LH128_17382 [Sphingomonas sp. LH128]